MSKTILLSLIYRGSFLAFPFLLVCLWQLTRVRKRGRKLLCLLFALVSLLFIRSRFIERQLIIVRETTIDIGFSTEKTNSATIVLIADMHLGVYKGVGFMNRVVDKINQLDHDYVMIAGDLTYWPDLTNLSELYSWVQDIEKPVYVVLGNHDVEQPGPRVRDDLVPLLEQYGARVLNNDIVALNGFELVGLGSRWNNEDDISLLDQYNESDTIVVLTHNPDTTTRFVNNNADATLVGHTHGGQIRIPRLYKHVIPTKGDFDRGLYVKGERDDMMTNLYITAGLGEGGLPMRLFNPPVIDLITLQ